MKYYYDDPLEALYMLRNFTFYLLGEEGQIVAMETRSDDVDYLALTFVKGSPAYHGKCYIRPDLYMLLKPRVGDIILDYDNYPRQVEAIRNDEIIWEGPEETESCYIIHAKIIQRNGKAFFAPKIEGDNNAG